MSHVRVRPARREDCPAILEIYNEAVLTTTASYDVEPRTLEHRLSWFDDHIRKGYGVFVAEDAEQVVGWSSLSPFHDRFGFRYTAENSVYVAATRRGQGIGARLFPPLLDSARDKKLHSLVAAIDANNAASLRLHARFGFTQVGHFREVGHKFERWLDVLYLQRMLML
jgi:L-amino acid N-acyltransferase YncA